MPTTVTKTIGNSGRDYTAPQAWEDACPASLVTADQIWDGEWYNDSGLISQLGIAGITTDTTRYVQLRGGPGNNSFSTNTNVRTNVLRYSTSNGVSISHPTNYSRVVTVSIPYCRIIGIQVRHTSATSGVALEDTGGTGTYTNCIFDGTRAGSIFFSVGFNVFTNCLFINRNASNVIDTSSFDQFFGCLVVHPTDAGTGGEAFHIGFAYGSNRILQNCAVFGCSAISDNTTSTRWDTTNSKNNATDLASGLMGSSNQHSVTYTSATPFTDGSTVQDWRSIAGTALDSNGFFNATFPNDISVTARNISTPTIGPWEITSAAAGAKPRQNLYVTQAVKRASYI